MASKENEPASKTQSYFTNFSSTFSSLTSTIQKQTEKGFPGTFQRLNEFSQTLQRHARELPNSLASIPGSLEAEHEKFIKEKANEGISQRQGTEYVAPWEGYGAYGPEMKKRILELSKDQRNFLFSPPDDTSFQFDMKAYSQSAKAALEHDPELARMRFLLVPQQVKEPIFWRNYFYRVTLTKQAVLSSTNFDPHNAAQEKDEAAEKSNVLFDFAEDDENDDDGDQFHDVDDADQTSSKRVATQETQKGQTPSSTPANTTDKKSSPETSASTNDEYQGMEDWEIELRRAANEGL